MKRNLFLGVILIHVSVSVFCQNKLGIDDLNKSGVTSLIEAISKGSLSKVDSLLNAGANPNIPDKNLNSPLVYCAWLDDIYSADLLLTRNANVNYIKSSNGSTALHQAAAFASYDLVQLLLESGASVDVKAKNDLTPLYEALIRGRYKTADVLLSHGADPNSVVCGVPFLCTAIIKKDTTQVKLLIKYSAKTDAIIQKTECTPQNATVDKNATQIAQDNEYIMNILKMKPSSITELFINKEEALSSRTLSISTTGHIVKIEGNRIQFEVAKGDIRVLKFNSQTSFEKKEGDKFIKVNGPSELKDYPMVTVRCDMQLNNIIKMYEGEIFFSGDFEAY